MVSSRRSISINRQIASKEQSGLVLQFENGQRATHLCDRCFIAIHYTAPFSKQSSNNFLLALIFSFLRCRLKMHAIRLWETSTPPPTFRFKYVDDGQWHHPFCWVVLTVERVPFRVDIYRHTPGMVTQTSAAGDAPEIEAATKQVHACLVNLLNRTEVLQDLCEDVCEA